MKKFFPGQSIFSEGDAADCAYIVEKGMVEISTEIEDEKSVLCVMGAGEIFGEMAILNGGKRSATARALTEVVVTKINESQIKTRMEEVDPVIRMLIMLVLDRFHSETKHFRKRRKVKKENQSAVIDTKNSIHYSKQIIDTIKLENDLYSALEENQFKLFFQPIVDLESLEINGFEALIRWDSPTRGIVSPDEFITVAESTSLIIPLGEWIIREAVNSLKILQKRVDRDKKLFVSVNVAGRQVKEKTFVQVIRETVKKAGINFSQLKLEVIERVMFENAEDYSWMEECRKLGVKIALDDFGTGYSSLSYLNKHAIDTIKIDRSFVNEIAKNQNSYNISKAIISLANALNIEVIGEGIETTEQYHILRALGCHFGQGFLFSKPVSFEDAHALLDDPFLRTG